MSKLECDGRFSEELSKTKFKDTAMSSMRA
jgi:hypothetical protein